MLDRFQPLFSIRLSDRVEYLRVVVGGPGETEIGSFLLFPTVSCCFLRFSAVSCCFLLFPVLTVLGGFGRVVS